MGNVSVRGLSVLFTALVALAPLGCASADEGDGTEQGGQDLSFNPFGNSDLPFEASKVDGTWVGIATMESTKGHKTRRTPLFGRLTITTDTSKKVVRVKATYYDEDAMGKAPLAEEPNPETPPAGSSSKAPLVKDFELVAVSEDCPGKCVSEAIGFTTKEAWKLQLNDDGGITMAQWEKRRFVDATHWTSSDVFHYAYRRLE